MPSFSGRRRDRALRVIPHAQGKTENGGEAFALGVMTEKGLTVPRLQLELPHPGNPNAADRPDFARHTRDGRLIVAELDARVKCRAEAMRKNGGLSQTIIAEREREERIRLVADDSPATSVGAKPGGPR